MTSRKSDQLIERYWAAKTSLEEEEALFQGDNQYPGINEWATYRKQNRKKAPSNLSDSVWSAIQNRRRNKRRILMGVSAVAASIVLFAVSFVGGPGHLNMDENGMTYYEKEALLNDALSMFANEKTRTSEQNIIYEDDVVIIYMASQSSE